MRAFKKFIIRSQKSFRSFCVEISVFAIVCYLYTHPFKTAYNSIYWPCSDSASSRVWNNSFSASCQKRRQKHKRGSYFSSLFQGNFFTYKIFYLNRKLMILKFYVTSQMFYNL